jgi:hypothetical protein
VPCKANVLEACVFLIALEDGTSNVLHIPNFTPFSRASNFLKQSIKSIREILIDSLSAVIAP